MKHILIAFALAACAAVTVVFASGTKDRCTCTAGGACVCPAGKCTCASGETKEACSCPSGGTCVCPEGKCACAPAASTKTGKKCGCACCKGREVCCCHEGDSAAKATAPTGHPLKGVVVEVRADKKALLVKHEEIPGVMKAMTMLLRVDDAALASVKKGDVITATLTNEDGAWWLHDVKRADR